ncbi:hypothetical protein C4588_05820 [Candidatus Parcubacteria bacterium]|nr:MAG: hypothetical protein C4588_05820 [Candidatus Parcubacteria bacterium]
MSDNNEEKNSNSSEEKENNKQVPVTAEENKKLNYENKYSSKMQMQELMLSSFLAGGDIPFTSLSDENTHRAIEYFNNEGQRNLEKIVKLYETIKHIAIYGMCLFAGVLAILMLLLGWAIYALKSSPDTIKEILTSVMPAIFTGLGGLFGGGGIILILKELLGKKKIEEEE